MKLSLSTTLTSLSTLLLSSSQLTQVSAFSNTHPLLALSSIPLPSLPTLLTPTRASLFVPPSSPQHLLTPSTENPLCSLSSILLLSIPNLHYSDLSSLSSLSSGEEKWVDPYLSLPVRRNFGIERVGEEFVRACSGGKVKVVVEEELGEWELVGRSAREGRKKVLKAINRLLEKEVKELKKGGEYLVVVTTVSEASLKVVRGLKVQKKHQKRQFELVEADDEDLETTSTEFDAETQENPSSFTEEYEETESYLQEPTENRTSIFAYPANSGLLHRYVFFTPILVFSILLTLLILLPATLLGANILLSTETLAGLETKMTGTVGLDPSKA